MYFSSSDGLGPYVFIGPADAVGRSISERRALAARWSLSRTVLVALFEDPGLVLTHVSEPHPGVLSALIEFQRPGLAPLVLYWRAGEEPVYEAVPPGERVSLCPACERNPCACSRAEMFHTVSGRVKMP